MSLDKSLKGSSRLAKKRNVLKRAERVKLLKQWEVWDDRISPFGLPKIRPDKPIVKLVPRQD
jgi:small basic protein (TIGR04137 family)